MEDAVRSGVAQAVEIFATYLRSMPPAAPSSSTSSSLPTPECVDIEKVHAKAEWLVRMLAWVRATLEDAEDMNMTSPSVLRWLRELEGVADAAEDVLDEFLCEAKRLRSMQERQDGGCTPAGETTGRRKTGLLQGRQVGAWTQAGETTGWRKSKLLQVSQDGWRTPAGETMGWRKTGPLQVNPPSSIIPRHKILDFLHRVEGRIEEIASRFGGIKKPRRALRREYSNIKIGQWRAEALSATRPTTSATQEPCVFGRHGDLAAVKEFLLLSDAEASGGDDGTDVPAMAIVGMGGLGKTTLAQLAYHDDQVDQHFQLRSWVCVSEGSDLVQLTKAMLQSLDPEAGGISELDPLQRKLVSTLDGKKFLLVLDDVWEVESLSSTWGLFTAPLRSSGSAGSKIIITTRNKMVSQMGGRISTYELPCLPDEYCLKLFNEHAFGGQDPNLYPNLAAIGGKIAGKCRGLPLVAKTLGGLLHTTDDEKTWNGILENEVWSIGTARENSVMPILRLSYRHLPARLKRCFRYCSVFPKDYLFDRGELIRMWMAHGYIKAERRKLIEDIGNGYFDDLLSRSFFQYSQTPQRFLMHDLIHDLARCASGDECCSSLAEVGNPRLIPRHVRHFSLVITHHDTTGSLMATEDASEPQSIRSFLLIQAGYFPWLFQKTSVLPSDLRTGMEHLRVLVLVGVPFTALPESITRLKHLRYLALCSSSESWELPESISNLYHLQTLDFTSREWYLRRHVPDRFPDSISNLVNLRHLIYDKDVLPVEYPVGIGRLTNLQTMPGFKVSQGRDCAKLGELEDMNNIQGSLAITEIDNLTDVNEAKKACLEKKRNLRSLHLEWRSYPSCIEGMVLESLKPSPKLENLHISGFKGASHPRWLGHPSFSKLAKVELEGCQNWTSLPQLGHLPSLKSLSISAARGVEYVGREFFSGGFPQLETLALKDMDNWRSWCGAQRGDCPKLRRLHITSCKLLESLSVAMLDALQDLHVGACPHLLLSSGSLRPWRLPSLQKVIVDGVYGVGLLHGDFSRFQWMMPLLGRPCLRLAALEPREAFYVLGKWPHIRQLTVSHCEKLASLPLCILNALTYLKISDCPQVRFSSGSLRLQQLPSLQEIHVDGIDGAGCVHGFFSRSGNEQALETSSLELANVDQLEALSVLDQCSSVRRLTISRCADLTSLPLGNLDALEYLKIGECPHFQMWNVERVLPTLQVLCFYRCPSVTERFRGLANLLQSDDEGEEDRPYLMLRDVLNAREAATFCSGQLHKVGILELEWDCRTNITSNADAAAVVLDEFHASSLLNDLLQLLLRGYAGSRFPSWLGNTLYDRLSTVTLQQCSQCEILPPLGQLPFLRKLYVEGATRLERVGREFSDAGSDGCSFPNLEMLEFHNMPAWEEWLQGAGEDDFPSLRKLVLKNCPKLGALPRLPLALEELELEACEQLVSLAPFHYSAQGLQSLESLKRLVLAECPKLNFSATERPPLSLRYMALTRCPSLRAWCYGLLRTSVHTPVILLDGFHLRDKRRRSTRSWME